jgi:hypothetical protein
MLCLFCVGGIEIKCNKIVYLRPDRIRRKDIIS